MRHIVLSMFFFVVGCSIQDKNILLNTGEKPSTFFKFSNIESMNDYVFDSQKFSFKFPLAKETDFTKMGGWSGESMRDGHTIALSLENSIVYSIVFSTNYKPLLYNDIHKAIETGNIKYIRSKIKIDNNDKLYITHFGKEEYKCTVMKYTKEQYPSKKYTAYECYKFNENRTKYRSVHVRLTYTKENNASINQRYSYQDLENRAQRMLDSLYIKDGWDE